MAKKILNKAKLNSVIDLLETFPDEKSCREQLERMRWDGKPICPYCKHDKIYRCKTQSYKCAKCRRLFNVTVGTIFENSKVPLRKWFLATFILTSHKKGIASMQLAKDIDVTQKTAWFMLHRIRHMLSNGHDMSPLEGVVEIDEMYVGGKPKKGTGNYNKRGRGTQKLPVIGMTERTGKRRARAIPVETADRATIHRVIKENIAKGATIITDQYQAYNGLDKFYDLKRINKHKDGYSKDGIHVNTIEGLWGIMKRGIVGIYHYTSPKHFDLYCDEFTSRYSTMLSNESDRFEKSLQKCEGRLKRNQLYCKPIPKIKQAYPFDAESYYKNRFQKDNVIRKENTVQE